MKKNVKLLLFYLLLPVLSFAQLSIYKGTENKTNVAWVYSQAPGSCSATTTTQNLPYEGTEHYQFAYNITSYYAGFGLGLNPLPVDFSSYTHIRIAHRGLNSGQYASITLRNPPDSANLYSESVKLLPSATYVVTEIPLSKLVTGCSSFDLKKINQISISISGVQVSMGNLYIDAIELINKPRAPLDDDLLPSVAASAKTWNRAKTLGYGVNLDIKTQTPGLGYDPFRLWTEQEIINLARMNVKTIRCATTIEYFMSTTAPYTINFNSREGKLLDSMVTWAVRHNINLIIDNHVGIETEPNNAYWREATYLEDISRTSALWKQLTLRYKDKNADKIFFEIKNEPGISGDNLLSNRTLRKINHAVIDTIRRYDKDRTLVVTTSGYSPVDSLIVSRPYNDDNLIYTFHSYEPGDFTYQGFTWFVNYNIDIPFPKANDIAVLTCLYTKAKQWSVENNVPIFNGEFGVSGRSDPTSRCNYMSKSCQLMDSLGIPAMYYSPETYYYGFGFFKGAILKDSMVIPCFADALHFTRPNITPPTSKILYKGGKTEIVSGWINGTNSTLAETTADNPFEGGQHYKLSYNSTTVWNGAGINFHDVWGYTKPPLDFTDGNYTHVRLSYRGLSPGQTLRAQFTYLFTRRDNDYVLRDQSRSGLLLEIGTYSADYKTVDIPLQSLINPNSTDPLAMKGLWFISRLNFYLSDPTQAGTVYIDGIELVNKNIVANVPPSVEITYPDDNSTFAAPASVTINAIATDTDGTISKVEFYNGSTLLGTDNTASYSYNWTNVPAGMYTITAKAYDNLGAVTTSAPVKITVTGSTGNCLEDDYAELKKLYDATNGANWTNKTGWLTDPNIANWYGITLTADGCAIKHINLSTNNLTGTLPALTLPELESFNVADNKITGIIPSLSMPKLIGLYLYTNQLTGTIPTLNMPTLNALWLSTNQLTGTIPDFNLPNLLDLRLRFCQFSGRLPLFNNTKLNTAGAVIWLTGNRFVFGDLENRPWLTTASDLAYAPQQNIKLNKNVNTLSVSTGSADNVQTFDWYKDGVLLATNQNSSYQATVNGKYSCRVKHNTLTIAADGNRNLVLQTDTLDVVISVNNTAPALKINDTQAGMNSTVRIPVTLTKNIGSLKGFQLFFKANNPNIVTFTGITPKKFTNPPFTISVDTSRNTAGEMGILGFTLDNCSTAFVEGDTLFTINARIRGTVGQMDSLNFSGANKLVLCDGATAQVAFQGGKVTIANTTYKIAGLVAQPISRKGISKVMVNTSSSGQMVATNETDLIGNYTMDVSNANAIIVKPSKMGLLRPKVDIDDITSMVEIVLNTNQNPYQRIAADWNCDNKIDIDDILGAIDYILKGKLAASCTNDWFFVPSTTVLTGNYPYNYSNDVSFPALTENKTLNYWGMMRGDVNGNVATNVSAPNPISLRGAANIELTALNKAMESGKTYQIPIRVKNFKNIKNFQGVINYDKNALTVQSVAKNTILGQQIFGVNQDSIGKIALLWANFAQGGVSLLDKDTLINLTVVAKKTLANLSNILVLDTTGSTLLIPKAANTTGDSLKLSFAIDFTSPITEGGQNITYFNVFPNPSRYSITIEAQFKQVETIDFMVINAIGQVVEQRKLNTLQVKETLNVAAFTEGMYQVVLQTANGRIARTITVVK